MTEPREAGGVGYVLRRFPVLSETFILNEILALEARGLPVHVFSLAPPRDPRFHEGVMRLKASITYVPGPSDWRVLLRHHRRLRARHPKRYRRELTRVLGQVRPRLAWRFLQAGYVADRARRFKLAHLHAHFANRSATVAHLASRLIKTPFSFTAHAFDIFRDVDRGALVRKLRAARFTATVSDYNVEYLKGILNGRPARIELVRNGIDLERFSPPAESPSDDPFTLLTVARLVEKKGLPTLIEACRLLRDRGCGFRAWIAGKGALKGTLERTIREADLGDRVHLLGPLTQGEVRERYHRAHALVLPCQVGEDGNKDGLPVSIVEALASGLPVVSTPVTGIPEAVHHGVNGLLVAERDPIALADALEKLMKDAELRERLAAAARPSVVAAYDQEATAEQLLKLLREETS